MYGQPSISTMTIILVTLEPEDCTPMQSTAPDVTTYIQEAPEDRQPFLIKLREIFAEELKGYKESMRYGGPCYEKEGVAEAGFASQKNYIGVYILKKGVMDRYKGELKGVSMGKGVMRFANFQKIDFEVIRKMVAGTYSSSEKVC